MSECILSYFHFVISFFFIIFWQERFDSQRVENERLIHQLEVALTDAKKQAETQKEKSMAKVIKYNHCLRICREIYLVPIVYEPL